MANIQEHSQGEGPCLGKNSLVHLVLPGRGRVVSPENVITADSVFAGVSGILEEGALVPVLLKKFPALLWRLALHLRPNQAAQSVNPQRRRQRLRLQHKS